MERKDTVRVEREEGTVRVEREEDTVRVERDHLGIAKRGLRCPAVVHFESDVCGRWMQFGEMVIYFWILQAKVRGVVGEGF